MSTATLEVAETIKDQLGIVARAMMGAKDMVGGEDFLQFRIGRNPKRISKIRITLTPADVYTVGFYRTRKSELVLIPESHDVYCDMLHAIIEKETGLDLSI